MACVPCGGRPLPAASARAELIGARRPTLRVAWWWGPRGVLRRAKGWRLWPSSRPPRSIRRARRNCCVTDFMTTVPGFSPASVCLSCSATISSRGKQSDAIPRAALSSRCFIRRQIFRRHLRTIFTIGVSAATDGGLSRRPPCRSRCAGLYASMTRAARWRGRRSARKRLAGCRLANVWSSIGWMDRVAWPLSATLMANRLPRSATGSRKASSSKTATVFSAATSVTCSLALR